MKKQVIQIILSTIVLVVSCAVSEDNIVNESTYDCAMPLDVVGEQPPKHAQYQALIDDIVSRGVPGMMMTVYNGKDANGPWAGSSGKADLKSNVDIKNCNISRVGSTIKMFTAVAIMQLVEEGKLNLEDKAAKYLSNETINQIENADKATVRQLLQHSSGIYNYIINPHFQTASLNDLIKSWSPNELLSYARNKKANFAPGTDVDYSNTNYVFLGKIIETIEGKPFFQAFQERIFQPLNLTFTTFAAEDPVPDNIIRGYIDLYGKLEVTDATYFSGWDYYTADGGLISNPYDLYLFLKAVVTKNIVSQESFDQMTDWVSPSFDSEQFYGLGIFKIKTKFGEAYIHNGDAIGYAAAMLYLPDYDTFICWAVNGNYGKIDELTQGEEAIDYIIEKIIE